MPEPKEIFPVDMGRGKGKADPNVRDFRPRHALEDTTEPSDVELAMLEEQIRVAEELGVDLGDVNPPSEVNDQGEADRPMERSKPA